MWEDNSAVFVGDNVRSVVEEQLRKAIEQSQQEAAPVIPSLMDITPEITPVSAWDHSAAQPQQTYTSALEEASSRWIEYRQTYGDAQAWEAYNAYYTNWAAQNGGTTGDLTNQAWQSYNTTISGGQTGQGDNSHIPSLLHL